MKRIIIHNPNSSQQMLLPYLCIRDVWGCEAIVDSRRCFPNSIHFCLGTMNCTRFHAGWICNTNRSKAEPFLLRSAWYTLILLLSIIWSPHEFSRVPRKFSYTYFQRLFRPFKSVEVLNQKPWPMLALDTILWSFALIANQMSPKLIILWQLVN